MFFVPWEHARIQTYTRAEHENNRTTTSEIELSAQVADIRTLKLIK